MTSVSSLLRHPARRFLLAASLVMLVLAPACADGDDEDTEFTDPFAYCEAVTDVDAPDDRYAGEAVPDSVVEGIRASAGIADDAPGDLVRGGTSWRCMDGEVWACFVGANLPCGATADTSGDPSTEMEEFCAANPDAEVIPAAVTGRETVFAWSCEGEDAVAGEQVFQVDDRGFIADIWYQLESPGA